VAIIKPRAYCMQTDNFFAFSERKLDTAATTSAPGSAPVAITATPPVAAAIYSLCNIEKRFSGEDR